MGSFHDLPKAEKQAMAVKFLTKEYPKRIAALPTFKLYAHPFRLQSLDQACVITYLNAGSSRSSLEQMCCFLQLNISPFGEELTPETIQEHILALRIIYAKEEKSGRHRVYFEVLTAFEYYMSGEATDFSGGGGDCKERLEIIFEYLAEAAGIEVEKVTVSHHTQKNAKKMLRLAETADCNITKRYHRLSDHD